jgi:hypothetical protein
MLQEVLQSCGGSCGRIVAVIPSRRSQTSRTCNYMNMNDRRNPARYQPKFQSLMKVAQPVSRAPTLISSLGRPTELGYECESRCSNRIRSTVYVQSHFH